MNLELDLVLVRSAYTLAVTTTIRSGACGVFGPSGAGKSTLLHLVAGLVRPTRGRIVLNGVVFDDVAAGIHVPPHRRRLGLVFQHGHLLPHRDVAGNLRYGEGLLPVGERRIRFVDVVDLLELGDLLPRRPSTLSGGQRQRVALGRALLCSPRLLLLDEPLAALDGALKRQILPYLRRVREAFGMPMLHVSHDLAELLQVVDDLLLLDRGRLAARGTPGEIARVPGLLPLLHGAGLVNVLRGVVAAHVREHGLTRVELAGGVPVWCSLREGAIGSPMDLLLRPDDVVLAAMPPVGLSLQNQLPGTVRAIAAAGDRVLVTVDAGVEILAEVSPRTVVQLGLAPGRPAWVLFKALAIPGG